MKKIGLIGLIGLTVFLILIFSQPAYAQNRGALTNVWASWVSVTQSTVTMTLPSTSRDIAILNGSTVDICVDPTGGGIPGNCARRNGDAYYNFQLDGASEVYLTDFISTGISLRSTGATASPISV